MRAVYSNVLALFFLDYAWKYIYIYIHYDPESVPVGHEKTEEGREAFAWELDDNPLLQLHHIYIYFK